MIRHLSANLISKFQRPSSLSKSERKLNSDRITLALNEPSPIKLFVTTVLVV